MYYSSGNYEAFARPKKPEGVDNKSAYIVGSGHAALIRDFYDAVRNNRPFAIDSDEGGKAIELLLAVYKSAETGERIEL